MPHDLIVDPACEVNERGTRDKNDGNEVVDYCDLPLDLELTERVEVDDETLPYAEEDWDCPKQTEIDKRIQPDFPLTMETRQSKKGRSKKKYNPYGEDIVIDRIVLSDMMDSLVGLDKIAVPREIDSVNDMDQDWIDDRSEPEVEFEPEEEQTHEQELTNLTGRQARTLFRGETSPARIVRTGVPQGSVISPTLFNSYVGSLSSPPEGVNVVSYADDVTPWASGPKINIITVKLQPYLDSLTSYFQSLKLALSPGKCAVTLLTPDTKECNVQPHLTVADIPLKLEKHPKVLGVRFHPMFKFG